MKLIGANDWLFVANNIDSPYAFMRRFEVDIYWFCLKVRESPYDTETKGTNDPEIVWSDQWCLTLL